MVVSAQGCSLTRRIWEGVQGFLHAEGGLLWGGGAAACSHSAKAACQTQCISKRTQHACPRDHCRANEIGAVGWVRMCPGLPFPFDPWYENWGVTSVSWLFSTVKMLEGIATLLTLLLCTPAGLLRATSSSTAPMHSSPTMLQS